MTTYNRCHFIDKNFPLLNVLRLYRQFSFIAVCCTKNKIFGCSKLLFCGYLYFYVRGLEIAYKFSGLQKV